MCLFELTAAELLSFMCQSFGLKVSVLVLIRVYFYRLQTVNTNITASPHRKTSWC